MFKCVYSSIMDTFTLLIFLGLSLGSVVRGVKARCPSDYRRRVETCIMEAQLAPQAGGGITLVLKKDTIVDLCDRGILRKTIDCLEEIHSRCLLNSTVVQELDRLYSVPRWEQGEQLLCRNTQLFQNNFDCLFRSASSVTSCVLMRTHTFRMGLAFTDRSDHVGVRDVTCSFAESIVKCLCSPMESHCPGDVTKSVAGAMRLFLPPYCLDDNVFVKITPQPEPSSTPDHTTKRSELSSPPDDGTTVRSETVITTKRPDPVLDGSTTKRSQPILLDDETTKQSELGFLDDTTKRPEFTFSDGTPKRPQTILADQTTKKKPESFLSDGTTKRPQSILVDGITERPQPTLPGGTTKRPHPIPFHEATKKLEPILDDDTTAKRPKPIASGDTTPRPKPVLSSDTIEPEQ